MMISFLRRGMRTALGSARAVPVNLEPDGTLTLNGDPLTLNGEYLTLGNAS